MSGAADAAEPAATDEPGSFDADTQAGDQVLLDASMKFRIHAHDATSSLPLVANDCQAEAADASRTGAPAVPEADKQAVAATCGRWAEVGDAPVDEDAEVDSVSTDAGLSRQLLLTNANTELLQDRIAELEASQSQDHVNQLTSMVRELQLIITARDDEITGLRDDLEDIVKVLGQLKLENTRLKDTRLRQELELADMSSSDIDGASETKGGESTPGGRESSAERVRTLERRVLDTEDKLARAKTDLAAALAQAEDSEFNTNVWQREVATVQKQNELLVRQLMEKEIQIKALESALAARKMKR